MLFDTFLSDYRDITGAVNWRYCESFSDNPEEILTDIQKILDATDKEEYLQDIARWKRLADLEKDETSNFYLFYKRLLQDDFY